MNQLAAYLQVHPKTIRQYVRDGWPHARIGRAIRFTRDHVDAWISNGEPVQSRIDLTPTGRSVAAHRRRTRSA